jgi:hypothetical protein
VAEGWLLPRELRERLKGVHMEIEEHPQGTKLAEEQGFLLGIADSTGRYTSERTPIVPCANNCGRWAVDLRRDDFGNPIPEHTYHNVGGSAVRSICEWCEAERGEQELEEDVLELLERKLGLAERHRDALRSFIETIFTDPQKILQVQDLDNRVRSLQTQVNVLWGAVLGAIITLFVLVVTLIAAS